MTVVGVHPVVTSKELRRDGPRDPPREDPPGGGHVGVSRPKGTLHMVQTVSGEQSDDDCRSGKGYERRDGTGVRERGYGR